MAISQPGLFTLFFEIGKRMLSFNLKFMSIASTATFLIAELAVTASVRAQILTQIAPSPTRWGTTCSWFLDSQRGFATGGRKSLSRTTDGGRTWTSIPLPGAQDVPLYNVTFLDANTGIATGNSASGSIDIFRTTNGGQSWTPVTGFPLGGSWYHQKYVSATSGFIGANGALVRTMDAGATWQLRAAYPDCPSFTGMDFLDLNTGLGSGGRPSFESGVFKTTNGGSTWTLKLEIGTEDVLYLSPTIAIAATANGVYRSEDSGETWFPTGAIIATGMVDLDKLNSTTIVGVSGKGDIWRSIDGGYTWFQQWMGEGDLPSDWSVRFSTQSLGSVAGGPSTVLQTTDGGQTWHRVTRGANFNAYAIGTLGPDKVITAGYHGYLQTMIRNGSWNLFLLDPPTFGRDSNYSALSTVGLNFAYAVGHWGGLARSLDGGATWQTLNGAVSNSFYANDVKFTDPMQGWMTGWDYPGPGTPARQTFTTSDGGLSWQVSQSGNFPGIAIEIVGQRIWIQAGSRAQWRSINGGATFVAGQLPLNAGSNPSVADLSFKDENVGYACGYDGYLVRTLDGGVTWTQLGTVTTNVHNLGVLAFGDEVWVCGARAGGGNAFVKRSINRGQSWQAWNVGTDLSVPQRLARSGTRLYVAGDRGELWMMSGLPKWGRYSVSEAIPAP